jgi:putative hemolysin
MKNLITLSILSLVLGSSAFAGPSVTSGTGNPAAVLCVKASGQYLITTDANGNQSGVCAFGEAAIEGWALFHAVRNNQDMMAVQALLNNQTPTFAGKPAAYCKAVGGTVYQNALGSKKITMCEFEDGSAIEVKTLFAGANSLANEKLVNLLTK